MKMNTSGMYRFEKPLEIMVDGKRHKGVIMKPV